jgi:hypothetical protein
MIGCINGKVRELTSEEETAITSTQSKDEILYDILSYADCINTLIREKYSESAELALLRQRDTKVAEFAEYNAYAEECKQTVKAKFAELGRATE